MYKYFLAVLVFLATPLCMAQIPAEVEEAFGNTAPVARDTWAYTRTENSDETITVERFDPRSESRWSLISIDGAAPSDKQLKKARERHARRDASDDFLGKNEFTGLALTATWELINEDAGSATYQFTPAPEEETAKFIDALQGELTVNRTSKTVQSFRIYNTKPFKPAAVAKVKEMNTAYEYKEAAPGVVLISRIALLVKGKAFGLKKINVQQEIVFSELEYRSAK